jgi:acetylornithine deacetylase
MNPVKLLIELIKIKSFSNQEIDICNYVYSLLKKEGFSVSKQSVDANGFNIIAKTGNPRLYLCAHLDTVKDSLPIKETASAVFGRGACDTKASVSAMICAAVESKKKNISDFGLVFTVGEEYDFRGAKLAAKLGMPFAVVGEPTNLDIVNGHYGIIAIKLTAKGKRAHSSEPEKGINALDILFNDIAKIKKIKLQNGSINLAKINGGIADNVVPDHAEAEISFRIHPRDKTDYLKKIKSLVKSEVTVILNLKGVFTAVPKQIAVAKHRVVKYGTELSLYKTGIVLGPGDINYAHSSNEQISKDQLKKAVALYQQILGNY